MILTWVFFIYAWLRVDQGQPFRCLKIFDHLMMYLKMQDDCEVAMMGYCWHRTFREITQGFVNIFMSSIAIGYYTYITYALCILT